MTSAELEEIRRLKAENKELAEANAIAGSAAVAATTTPAASVQSAEVQPFHLAVRCDLLGVRTVQVVPSQSAAGRDQWVVTLART